MSTGPLRGLVVVDLSERSVASAVAGMVLSDYGADVTRIEPPGGDPLRALPGVGVWYRGQRTLIADRLTPPELDALCRGCDVVIDTLHARRLNPSPWRGPAGDDQVVCLLSAEPIGARDAGLGDAGAEAVYGAVLEARYGLQAGQQGHRPGPIFEGWPHAVHGAAWLMELGILAAVHARAAGGGGQVVTTSLADGLAILSTARWVGTERFGPAFSRSTVGGPGTGTRVTVTGLLRCSDGCWAHIHTGARGAFERLFTTLGRPDLAAPENGMPPGSTALSSERTGAIWDFLVETFAGRPVDHWVRLLAEADVPAMPVLGPGEALLLPQMDANRLARTEGRTRSFGIAATFSPAPARSATPRPRPTPSPPGEDVSGPLAGLLVLDFGIWIAGPFANRLFADLGARVIKIEERRGDPLRGTPRHFVSSHRGKENLAVDLKMAEGRDIAHRLAARADIVHHNMRAGVMERLGIGYDQLRQLKPDLIYCHSSGYGNSGGWAGLPAFEPLHSALAGLLVRTGGPGRPPLHYLTHMDFGCALTSAVAVLAALVHRDRTGEGQYLECPQIGSALLAMADVHLVDGERVDSFEVDPDQRGHGAGDALYRCSDGWLTIAVGSQPEWEALHLALGLRPVSTYATSRRTRFDRDPAARRLEERLGAISVGDAAMLLRSAGVANAVPVEITSEEALMATDVGRAGGIETMQHPVFGRTFAVGRTLRFSAGYDERRRRAPLLGEHTAAILEELGYGSTQRDRLFARGVVGGPSA